MNAQPTPATPPNPNAPLIQWTSDEFFKLAAKVEDHPQSVQVALQLLQARLISVPMFKQLLELNERPSRFPEE
ncbi:MAG: hypothetical protein ACKO34_00725 [Vampirovibrionales bacterium]